MISADRKRERERERESQSFRLLLPEELESSPAASDATQTRYFPRSWCRYVKSSPLITHTHAPIFTIPPSEDHFHKTARIFCQLDQ